MIANRSALTINSDVIFPAALVVLAKPNPATAPLTSNLTVYWAFNPFVVVTCVDIAEVLPPTVLLRDVTVLDSAESALALAVDSVDIAEVFEPTVDDRVETVDDNALSALALVVDSDDSCADVAAALALVSVAPIRVKRLPPE